MTDWRETCDFETFENSTHKGEWFMHWFLIVLACGGARVAHWQSPERLYGKV